jgi:hypothetical protein
LLALRQCRARAMLAAGFRGVAMADRPFTRAELERPRQWDQPTICNGLLANRRRRRQKDLPISRNIRGLIQINPAPSLRL